MKLRVHSSASTTDPMLVLMLQWYADFPLSLSPIFTLFWRNFGDQTTPAADVMLQGTVFPLFTFPWTRGLRDQLTPCLLPLSLQWTIFPVAAASDTLLTLVLSCEWTFWMSGCAKLFANEVSTSWTGVFEGGSENCCCALSAPNCLCLCLCSLLAQGREFPWK